MKLNFQKKLFLYISCLIICLIIFFSIIFSFYVYQNMAKESIHNLSQITSKTASELNTLFDDIDNLALYVSTNPSVRSAFTTASRQSCSDKDLSDQLGSILTSITIPNNSSRFRICLYNSNRNFISTGIPYNKAKAQEILNSKDYSNWYHSLPLIHSQRSVSSFHSDHWSYAEVPYISLYREIFDSTFISRSTGIIEVQCPYTIINKILSFDAKSYQSYLFNTNGDLIYSSKDDISDAKTLFSYYDEDLIPLDIHGTYAGNLYSSIKTNLGWTFIVTQSQHHIFNVILPVILIIFLMGIMTLMITLSLIFLITKRTTQPLRELTASVEEVSLANLSLETSSTEYPDEFTKLNRSFERMFDRLKCSMDENIKIKACEMRANMIALQSQMDPHFLYNILTIIKALSREGNTKQIGVTCDYLVHMLRYISSYSDSLASMKDELTHTDYYLKLMKIRYEDQFEYTFDIDDKINLSLPLITRLSLQPIVENCFQHGFKKVLPPWHIAIKCWMDDAHWFLSVTDNGTGMTDTAIHELNQKVENFLSDPSSSIAALKIGGMGLVNTIARLKLKYKNEITFEIKRLPQNGTCITLEGVYNDESINCRR